MSTILSNELDARTSLVLEYLRHLGYQHVEREVAVSIGSRVLQADLVIYGNANRGKPFAVVEIKAGSGEEFHLLHPAVQTAFSLATALGDQVQYLLVSDGNQHQWFKRDSEHQSLFPIDSAPTAQRTSGELFHLPLIPVTNRDQFLNIAQTATQILRKESSVFNLHLAIDLNRIFIAKIFDEEQATSGVPIEFRAAHDNPKLASDRIKWLYTKAIEHFEGAASEEMHWNVSDSALYKTALLIEPYYFSSISQTVRDTIFWEIFPSLLPRDTASHTTPRLIASLLVRLARPTPTEYLIDPACGTGLLLIEALHYLISDTDGHHMPIPLGNNLLGAEINAEVATLARTNFALAKMSPKQIRLADSLSMSSLVASGILKESFDLVVTNPPIGRRPHELADSQDLTFAGSPSAPLEALFIERSLQLLKPNGRLAVLVPDTLLSSPMYLNIRRWILQRSDLRAIVGLPIDFVSPLGYSGRASILVIRKHPPQKSDRVLLAELGSHGLLSDKPDELHLARHADAIATLIRSDDIGHAGELEGAWTILREQLNPRRLDIPFWRTERAEQQIKFTRSAYPKFRLKDVAEIISGRNFRKHIQPTSATAVLIQAGAVREFHLDTESSPHISMEDYTSIAARAQLRAGDVLVTTTGQYLGRAAVAENISIPATVSGAVTILRPHSSLDPNYLAALLNSPICREQIEVLQASSTAQPYIRRTDLGEVSIPLPPIDKQREVSRKVVQLAQHARQLSQRSRELQEQAKKAVLDILETEDRE